MPPLQFLPRHSSLATSSRLSDHDRVMLRVAPMTARLSVCVRSPGLGILEVWSGFSTPCPGLAFQNNAASMLARRSAVLPASETHLTADIHDGRRHLVDSRSAGGGFWDKASTLRSSAKVESRRDAVAEGVGKSC